MSTRKGRSVAVVPLAVIEAEEANINRAVAIWCVRNLPHGYDTEASFKRLERMFLERLQDTEPTLDAAFIVDVALAGNPPAHRALQTFIRLASEHGGLDRLPTSVRYYLGRLTGPVAACYPSQGSHAVNDFLRDAALVVLMRRVKAMWPQVPLLNGSSRASVAELVGAFFGVSERQARRIFQNDKGQARRAAELLTRPSERRRLV